MGKNYCAIKDCHNTPGVIGRFGKKVKLHHLPKDKALKRAWILAVSRKHFKPTSYTLVCSDHFPDGDGRTWKHTVPTLFLPQKKEKEVRKRTTNNSSDNVVTMEVNEDSVTSQSESDLSGMKEENAKNTDSLHFHSYSKCDESQEGDVDPSTAKCTRVCFDTDDQNIQVIRPEITLEDLRSDCDIQFYTGLPNRTTFIAVFESLISQGADRLDVDGTGLLDKPSSQKLRLVDEFLLVMMRLRLGLLLQDLEYRFKISTGRISRIFLSWIHFMHECMQQLVFLPKLCTLQQKIPACFHNFSDTRIILDCTEIFIQKPSSLENQTKTFSHYKSHNTYKALVGISMTGAVVFVSKLYGGIASDVFITRNSGLLQMLESGDAVMVDKGFIMLRKDFRGKNIKLYCPPFLSASQFSKAECECTRRVASARIHVERKMEQIKNFKILQGILPLSLKSVSNSMFFVCTALTNLLPPLVK